MLAVAIALIVPPCVDDLEIENFYQKEKEKQSELLEISGEGKSLYLYNEHGIGIPPEGFQPFEPSYHE